MISHHGAFTSLAADMVFYMHGWGWNLRGCGERELRELLVEERKAIIAQYNILYHGHAEPDYQNGAPYLSMTWMELNGMRESVRGWVMARVDHGGF